VICEYSLSVCRAESARFFTSGSAPTSPTDARLVDNRGPTSIASPADRCCAGSATCAPSLIDDKSKQAVAAWQTAKASAPTEGTRGSCEKTKEVYAAEAQVDAATAGACFTRKQLCVDKVVQWRAELARNFPTSLDDVRRKLDGVETKCKTGLSADSAKAAMDAALANSSDGARCEGSSTAGGGDSGSGSPANGDGGGGLGDVNPQALMGLLQAVMAAQQQQPETPPEQPVMDCSNEAIAGCQQGPTAQNTWNPEGSAELKSSGDSTGGFNPEPSSVSGAGPVQLPSGESTSRPNAAGTVPNGGGGIPGGGGGGAASLGGGGAAGAQLASGKNTDIMHGERGGGGFAQTNAAMTLAPGSAGGYGGYGRADDSQPNLDLAQYLPKEGGRRLAGSDPQASSAQINSSGVNIWNRISDHFKSRCNQGLLRDCVP